MPARSTNASKYGPNTDGSFRKAANPEPSSGGSGRSGCDRAVVRSDGTLLPHPLDLIQSKLETGRDKDLYDIQHLESLVRADYKQRLPTATLAEATELLGRYSEWQVLVAALENPLADVRELAMTHLREFAAAGDPFSLAILEGRELP